MEELAHLGWWTVQIISKQFVIERDSVHYMRTERDVMTKVQRHSHPQDPVVTSG
jgi:hypothetical protein